MIGHGTRNSEGTAEFLRLAQTISERAKPNPVEPCFLELQEPTIEDAWQRLLARGAEHIVALPLLLFSAGHARRDIPDALTRCCLATQPTDRHVCFSQSAPLECHEKLLTLSRQRFNEAIDLDATIDPEHSALVMVGRGSLNESATAEMLRYTDLHSRSTKFSVVRTGFVAMAEPKITSVLDEVAQIQGIETIVVQPHLLFQGDLNSRIRTMVSEASQRYPDRHWIVTDHLGPDSLVGEALLELASRAV